MRGKVRFCVCPVFGRLAVAVLELLRDRQYGPAAARVLDGDLVSALEALRLTVQLLPDFRVPIVRSPAPLCVVLSDASFESSHTWLGFLVWHELRGCVWAGMPTPA